jgi:hypothetical protein
MAPPTNPRHNRRKWLDDERLCRNCGHTRAKHGNIGRGVLKRYFCVDWRYLVLTTGGRRICGCKVFEPMDEKLRKVLGM